MEKRITKQFDRNSKNDGEERWVEVEQVLTHDNKAAALVTIRATKFYRGVESKLEKNICIARFLFIPLTPKPLSLGMYGPFVGQWIDYQRELESTPETPKMKQNPNRDTHIDYFAWEDAFERVYSAS